MTLDGSPGATWSRDALRRRGWVQPLPKDPPVGGPDRAVVVLSFVLVVFVVTTAAVGRTIKETASLDTSY